MLDEPDGVRPVADGVFFFFGGFAEGFAIGDVVKDRVVAEAAVSADFACANALARAGDGLFRAVRQHECDGADKTCRAFAARDALEVFEQLFDVGGIARVLAVF